MPVRKNALDWTVVMVVLTGLTACVPGQPTAGSASQAGGLISSTVEAVEFEQIESSPTLLPSPTPIPTATPIPTPTPIPISDTPAAVAYVLPLTVQHVTGSSATLLFELDRPSEGVLAYRSETGSQIVLPLDPTQARHQITLDDLTPSTTYRALVGLVGDGGGFQPPAYLDGAWGEVTFRTVSNRDSFRFGVIGDSGFGESATYQLVEEMAATDLDFVLHVGDVVYQIYNNADPVEAYALKYYAPFSPVLHRMPVYPVIGNHDVEEATFWNDIPFYYYAFPPFPDPRFEPSNQDGLNHWYAFAYRDVQFVMLDTQTFYTEGGLADQTAWLTGRLADERFAYTVIVLHVPPYTSSGLHPDDGLPVQRAWMSLFESADVPLVLAGHSHNYERLTFDDLTMIISGGGSSSLYAPGEVLPQSEIFASQTHFVMFEAFPDRIEGRSILLDGNTLDTVTIPVPPS